MRIAPLLLLIAFAACKDDPDSSATRVASAPAEQTATRTYDFTALEQAAFGGTWKTEGVVIQHEGQIVYEKYAAGFTEKNRHILYSVSKSVGSALAGLAVNEGILKLDESICTYFPAPTGADPSFCDTKVEHVLQMRSGLQWTESYDDPTKSNVIPMLYGDEADMGAYVARQPRAAKAGEKFVYSTGDSNLLARAVHGALGSRDMRAWAKEKLFDPAGLSSAIFESDRNGTLVFGAGCFMTVRDMARFGQLYLDNGMNGTTQVLPASWVAYTKTPAPPMATPAAKQGSYGAAFWLNATSPTADAGTFQYPDLPADTYSAEGHWGQKIFIIPSKKLVFARTGNDRDPVLDPVPMVKAAIAAIDGAH